MKRGWFNDNWRHSLSARGISSTNRYFRRKPVAKKFISIAEGREKLPVGVYKDVVPKYRGTTGELKRTIRRYDILNTSQGKELLRLEKERDSLQSTITRLGPKSNPEVRKDLMEQLRDREAVIASMMELPKGSKAAMKLSEDVARASEKRSRLQTGAQVNARLGEISQVQLAAKSLTDVQKSALGQVERREGMRASEEKLVPRPGSKFGKQTIQDIMKKRQEKAEKMREGREISEEQQRPKKYERVEFPDEGDD